MYAGDMAKQMHQALDNLETVLKVLGLSLANVVRLSFYTTGIGAFYNDAVPAYRPRLEAAGGLQESMRIDDIVVCDRGNQGQSHPCIHGDHLDHGRTVPRDRRRDPKVP